MIRRVLLFAPLVAMVMAYGQYAWARPPGTGTADDIELRVNEGESAVLIDLDNKTNISGFIHLAFAWGTRFSPTENLLRGFINLKEAMHKYTNIETTIDDHVYLSSPELLKMPFLYITTDMQFDLTDQERKNLRTYFDMGGFVVLDNPGANLDQSTAEASLKKMIYDTLESQVIIAPLINDDELYHCYFDFEDGPPTGSEVGVIQTRSATGGERPEPTLSKEIIALEGIWYKGRLAGVYSGKGYIVKWQENGNNEPQLKMGVNMVVFSLIQEDSLALQRYLSSYY